MSDPANLEGMFRFVSFPLHLFPLDDSANVVRISFLFLGVLIVFIILLVIIIFLIVVRDDNLFRGIYRDKISNQDFNPRITELTGIGPFYNQSSPQSLTRFLLFGL